MALILNLETSTRVCSVALSDDGAILAGSTVFEKNYSHSERLGPMIGRVLQKAKKIFSDLDAVAVSRGPGSYTGLRIGLSTAKGICYAAGKPLIAVDTLKLMAAGCMERHKDMPAGALLCPMLDARRMEVYSAIFNLGLDVVRPVSAHVVSPETFAVYVAKGPVYFFGDGSAKCRVVLPASDNTRFMDDIHPIAKNMAELSEALYRMSRFEDTAYCEPYYLKDFVGRKARHPFGRTN